MIKHHISSNKGEEGIALLTAIVFISVAVMVLAALSLRTVNQHHQVSQHTSYEECFLGVETALAYGIADINNGGSGQIGVDPTWYDQLRAQVGPSSPELRRRPQFGESLVQPVSLASMPSLQYFTYVQDWGTDGIDNNGDGTIDDASEAGMMTLYASAQNRGVTRGAEVVMKGEDVNFWRNAIFAGAGQAGGLINGNVSIHGSVHLLGDNLLSGVGALEALDMSGTSLIHNNYEGLGANLRTRVPALPTVLFDGETVGSLDAKLRVRSGLVGMSGNSEIGEAHATGNTYKETMNGTYVNDGWTGTAVVDDGGRGDPKAVYSDNGWDKGYDLGNIISMPMLDDDYRDMTTGKTEANPLTGINYTHRQYFQQMTGLPYIGNLKIEADKNFYFNSSRPLDLNPANRQPGDDYILFNATTNQMEINGQIQVNGNVEITRGAGNDKTIHYTGRGAILAVGDVKLNTDLYSVNKDGSTANSFPVNSCFGIMAQGNMEVGTLSQLDLMGAFYAQGLVKTTKQTNIVGTIVGSYFDMGSNVPSIYQVPSLADNLPVGMIAYPIWIYNQVSWREIAVS